MFTRWIGTRDWRAGEGNNFKSLKCKIEVKNVPALWWCFIIPPLFLHCFIHQMPKEGPLYNLSFCILKHQRKRYMYSSIQENKHLTGLETMLVLRNPHYLSSDQICYYDWQVTYLQWLCLQIFGIMYPEQSKVRNETRKRIGSLARNQSSVPKGFSLGVISDSIFRRWQRHTLEINKNNWKP